MQTEGLVGIAMAEQSGAQNAGWLEKVDAFIHHLRTAVASFHDPKKNADAGNELSVKFGNIRFQIFPSEGCTSIGLIYETPPGSTNQIQIRCDHLAECFSIPERDADVDRVVRALKEATDLIDEHIADIPTQRAERVRHYIESWIEAGKDLSGVLAELNNMLQQEMKGGRITYDELAQACRYAYTRLAGIQER